MLYSVRRIMQYAGLIVLSTCLLNGITCNPLAADDAGMDAYPSVSSSFQPLLDAKESDSSVKASVAENYGKLPLSFEANNGQVDEAVKFLSRGNGYTLYLTSTETVVSLRRAFANEDEQPGIRQRTPDKSKWVENEVIRLKNIGTNPNPKIMGLKELPGKSNYFIGNEPEGWHTNIPNYAKVKVEDAYPGIDLVYYGNQQQLEYDWIVAPGADPKAIRFAVESKGDLKIDSLGNLLLDEKGEVRLNKPLIYQERKGDRTEIAGEYTILNKREVGIQVAKYDTALPLVIDPVLFYSTYLGGTGRDDAMGLAVDTSGNAYVAGATDSTDFPTENPLNASNTGQYDAYVSKMNATGDALIYSTYIGGFEADVAYGIDIDAAGSAYVVGTTESGNFPTVNPFQTSDAYVDAFVAKLNAAGNALIYSTYLGGDGDDYGDAIAVDASGNAYVVGETDSGNFPTENPFQASNNGDWDGFVTKLNTAGNALVYSTYLGGTDEEYGNAITVDASGNAYVTGDTDSTDFPTENPYQATNYGNWDSYVTKLNAAGDGLVYSTYLGGTGEEYGYAIAVDASGNAYAAGGTYSLDFPTEYPFQASHGGNCDAYVTKLNTAGDALVYSTYLGGSG